MEKCTTVRASTETYDISGEHREMNEEQLPVLLNVIPDVEDGRMGKEVTSPRGQMPFCNSNKLDPGREWVITSSTISPTPTKPGPYFMSDPKETRSKKVKRILCKVLCSRFFPQVRKKHYLIFQVYVHISRSSLILLKKKKMHFHPLCIISKNKQTNRSSTSFCFTEYSMTYWLSCGILWFWRAKLSTMVI